MEEIWKPIIIDGQETKYHISTYGRVKRFYKKKPPVILKELYNNKGYLRVSIRFNNKHNWLLVHRLVAIHFLDNPMQLPEVHHKDENPKNARLDNLKWVTHAENMSYSNAFYELANRSKGTERKIGKFNETHLISEYSSINKATEEGFKHSGIVNCARGRRKTYMGFNWKYL